MMATYLEVLYVFVDIVKFDNSYSWLHGKKVWYNIDVTEPSTDLPPFTDVS